MTDPRPDASRTVFRGRLLRVEVQTWGAAEREVVHHPGACAVVAVTPSGDALLVRQLREAVGATLLEIPAGLRDVAGEDPAGCAARELREETGHATLAVRHLATVLTSPGFADERIELFVARASEEPVAAPTEPGIQAVRMPLVEAVQAVLDGRIVDAKTCVGLLLASDARAGRTGILAAAPGAGPDEEEVP